MLYDYKHIFDKRWKKVNRDLERTIKKIKSKKAGYNFGKNIYFSTKKYSNIFFNLSGFFFSGKFSLNLLFSFIFLTFFIVATFVLSSIVFSNSDGKNKNLCGSYIGRLKINQEFKDNELNYGVGGPESYEVGKKDRLKFYFYEIQKGDSIYSISKKLGVTMDTIISLNRMIDAHNISEGKEILVPTLEGIIYTVKAGDTLEKIASNYRISVEDIKDANELEEEELYEGRILFLPNARLSETERQKALGYLFFKPLRGLYTSGFGIRNDPFTGERGYHTGIDVAKNYGAPVYAAKEGIVTFAGWNGGYGKCVVIKHQFGFETLYGHLSTINVSTGQKVKAGQFIGRVGDSGRSTGPHLHFEVRKFGTPINPLRIAGLGKSRGRWY